MKKFKIGDLVKSITESLLKQNEELKNENNRLKHKLKLQHVMFQLANVSDDDQKADKWRKIYPSSSLATRICGSCTHSVNGKHCSSCVDSIGNTCDKLFSCFTPLFEPGIPTLGVCKPKVDSGL